MRYDRARGSLDRHSTYVVAVYVAGAARQKPDCQEAGSAGPDRSGQAERRQRKAAGKRGAITDRELNGDHEPPFGVPVWWAPGVRLYRTRTDVRSCWGWWVWGDSGPASGGLDEVLRGGVPPPCRLGGDVAAAYPAIDAEELHAVGSVLEYLVAGLGQLE
jgi:hypothetical protein